MDILSIKGNSDEIHKQQMFNGKLTKSYTKAKMKFWRYITNLLNRIPDGPTKEYIINPSK